MTMMETLIASALADPFAEARAHVASGGRAIGLFGAETPIELVLAANAFPVQLQPLPTRPTPRADAFLESGFSPAARLVLEGWIAGDLDFLEAVILPRSSDNAQRLYYYACELRRRELLSGPEPLLFDLTKIDRATSVAHSRAAAETLAGQLRAQALDAGLARTDRRRTLLERLQASRSNWAGTDVERLLRTAGTAPFDPFNDALEAALTLIRPRRDGPRLMLAGSAPPDERLHAAVELGGGTVVAELHEMGCQRHGPTLGPSGNPLAAIAQGYHRLPYGTRSFGDRTALTLDRACASDVDAVIFWLIEEEEALIWELPSQLAALARRGIATLAITRGDWISLGDAPERITAFTRNLKVEA